MAKRQFKTESKRILDLMINSVYTHKEIFLRELISNASDAIDKLYFRSLTDSSVTLTKDDYRIDITLDKPSRVIRLCDNGCGMSQAELSENLGVIAHSGTLGFRAEQNAADIETIGQFGVGFYSAFMISKKLRVLSRAFGEEQAYVWESEGVDGYTVQPAEKDSCGTEVTLFLKDNTDDERYDEFLEEYRVSELVKRYSDYIRYPIIMAKTVTKDDGETAAEPHTLNSMIPIWRKNKSELTQEDYNGFYKAKLGDYADPLLSIHFNTEGTVSYNALLYIPSQAPYNYYTKDYEKGLQLYANGVLIMDKCAELLPDHFSFVRGLVDSQDLSLNISREMLQHDRQLKFMAKSIEKKIRGELEKLLADDREKYETFYGAFGLQIKYGMYAGFGMHSENLRELVMFHSLAENKLVTFKEYVSKMPEGQQYIYYVCADTAARAELMPQTERVREKGWDILCLTDDVDEFALKMVQKYDDREFRSVSGENIDLGEPEKEAQKAASEENKDMLSFMAETLDGKVSGVIVSARLGRHPVCLTSEGDLSIEMEKILSSMPTDSGVKAKRILELNAGHPVFDALKNLFGSDKDKLKTYANLLYTQALLIEGLPVEDPVAFSNDICALMV